MVSLSQESIDEFRARTALETALSQLDASWLILVDLRINGPTDATAADYVALHPRRGIALIDVILSRTGDPAQRLRKFLDAEGFSAQFPGTLPIVRLVLRPTEATTFGRRVHAAFADVPPITIADPSWMAVVNDLLVPADPSAPRPVLPLFKRSALRGNGMMQQRPRQTERPASRQDDTRAGNARRDAAWAEDTWAVAPERWPDKVAAAMPLKRSGKPAADDRPASAAPPAPPPARPPEAEPAAPVAQHPQVDREGAAPRIAETTIASEEFPAPSDEAIAPRREVPHSREELPREEPAREEPARGAPSREAAPATDRLHDWPIDEGPPPSASDQDDDERQAPAESPLAGLARTGQRIMSLVQFPTLHDAETPTVAREAPRTARQDDGADHADSPSVIAPIVRLVTRQHDRARRPVAEPAAAPRYEREHVALDSGLTAYRHDAFSEAPSAGASWRGHAAAAVVLVALLGGGIAWLTSGGSADRQVASLPPGSAATPLPVAPPAADAGSTGGAPMPSTQSKASPPSSLPQSTASVSPPAAAPAPAPPVPTPSAPAPPVPTPPAPAPSAAVPAPPLPANPPPADSSPKDSSPKDSSVATLTAPPPVAPPWPKAKPAPPPVAAPTDVANAPGPPAARPAPVAQPPEAKAQPPRALAEKSTPRTKARKTGKTERPEDQAATANSTELARATALRDLAPRDLSTRELRGPPIDLADLPPGETVTPSSSPAPRETQPAAATPTLASAAAARMHGPTSLLPPSPNAPASAQAGSSEVCRSYTSTKTLLGQQRQVSGLACRDTNGQWQIITELPD